MKKLFTEEEVRNLVNQHRLEARLEVEARVFALIRNLKANKKVPNDTYLIELVEVILVKSINENNTSQDIFKQREL